MKHENSHAHKTMRRLSATVLATALITGLGFSATAEAAPPAAGCGSTITSNVTLTRDLRCSDGDGITLAAGVTLNLGSHKLIGSGSGTGVTMSPEGGSTVKNGVIKNFETGVMIEGGLIDLVMARIDRVTLITARVVSSYTDMTMTGVTGTDSPININNGRLSLRDSKLTRSSVWVFQAIGTIQGSTLIASSVSTSANGSLTVDNSYMDGRGQGGAGDCSETTLTFTNSTVKNYSQGISGYYCVAILTNNRFTNLPNGVVSDLTRGFVDGDSTPYTRIIGNTFSYSGIVLKSGPMIVQNNIFKNNTTGVVFLKPEWSQAIGNTFNKNTDSGIYTDLLGLTVGGNKAVNNGRYGIYAPGAVDVGVNIANRNKLDQCVGLTCAVK